VLIDYDGVRLRFQNSRLFFIPRVNVSAERWWWCRLGITPELSTRARWQFNKQRHLERVGGMDEGMRILCIQYLWYVDGSSTCRKTLRHGTSGFTSHPKKVCCGFFSPLKIHRLGRVWTSGKHIKHYTTDAKRSVLFFTNKKCKAWIVLFVKNYLICAVFSKCIRVSIRETCSFLCRIESMTKLSRCYCL
jgi:hypothetical protein